MVLFLYGASGAAFEVYDMIERNPSIKRRYSKIIFVDDFADEGACYLSQRIKFKSCADFLNGEDAEFAITVGEPSARKFLREKVKNAGFSLATLIDESAVVSQTAEVGEGCVINRGAIISSNVKLAENIFVMFRAIIGHEADIGKDTTICPMTTIGAHCRMGEGSFVGITASTIQGVNVGKGAIIGMGAKVFREVLDGETVLGNPARVTKRADKTTVF